LAKIAFISAASDAVNLQNSTVDLRARHSLRDGIEKFPLLAGLGREEDAQLRPLQL
jgi:hypothetical protein